METLLRLVITFSGLPAPVPQVELFGLMGEFLARCDLLSANGHAVFEYDGQEHNARDRHAHDVRRWRALRAAGFGVYPYTAIDVFQRPQLIVRTISALLGFPRIRLL